MAGVRESNSALICCACLDRTVGFSLKLRQVGDLRRLTAIGPTAVASIIHVHLSGCLKRNVHMHVLGYDCGGELAMMGHLSKQSILTDFD